ncbi:MAG: pyruvate ferredoxin oxidoreductase [Oscillibacter sp.]|nr:pyruvate ferredoxin oxidoreductase [Oscillibacter sp.]
MSEQVKMFLNGDEAVAWAVRLCRPDVVSAYPITPQTIVVEKISEFVADGLMKCQYMHVESEHSAMASAMGASLAGARTFTATSSQGLAYMCEMLHYVSGSRFPIVMMNANRTLAAPWNIFGDQRDSISQRDSGWIQVYVENGQEALDMIIQAYRIAEHEKVYLPVMVNLDGFVNTHTYEMVEVPAQEDVDAFLPPFKSLNAVDFEHPKSYCISAGTDWNMEFRQQQQQATLDAEAVIQAVDKEYGAAFGRSYGGMLEEYRMEDAEVCLVALGSVNGTIKEVVDSLRGEGKKVGLVKLRFIRPFPRDYFKALAGRVKAVGIVSRDLSFGYEGAIGSEVKAAMQGAGTAVPAVNFVAGLAGRDIPRGTIAEMYQKLERAADGGAYQDMEMVDMRW